MCNNAGGRKAAAAGTLSEQELRREISNTDEIGWDGFSSAVGRLLYRKIANYCMISYTLRNTRPDFFQMVERYAYLMQLHDQAEQGSSDAQYNLGLCYFYGDGVEGDFAQAVEWFRKAAEQGLPEAQYNLGVCYYNGDSVEPDRKQAEKWLREAAEQGYPDAQ